MTFCSSGRCVKSMFYNGLYCQRKCETDIVYRQECSREKLFLSHVEVFVLPFWSKARFMQWSKVCGMSPHVVVYKSLGYFKNFPIFWTSFYVISLLRTYVVATRDWSICLVCHSILGSYPSCGCKSALSRQSNRVVAAGFPIAPHLGTDWIANCWIGLSQVCPRYVFRYLLVLICRPLHLQRPLKRVLRIDMWNPFGLETRKALYLSRAWMSVLGIMMQIGQCYLSKRLCKGMWNTILLLWLCWFYTVTM